MSEIKIGVIISPSYSYNEGSGKELYEIYLQNKINQTYPNITFVVEETDTTNDHIDPPIPQQPNSAQQHLTHFINLNFETDLFIGGAWSNQAAMTLKYINDNDLDVLLLSPHSDAYSKEIPNVQDPIVLAVPDDALYRLWPCTTYSGEIIASAVKEYIKYQFLAWSLDQVTIIHGKGLWGLKLANEVDTQLQEKGYSPSKIEKIQCPLQPNAQFNFNSNDTIYVEEVLDHLDTNSPFRNNSNTAVILILPWEVTMRFILKADDYPNYSTKPWFTVEPTLYEYEHYCNYITQNNISIASKIHVFTPRGTHKITPELLELQEDPWISTNMPDLSYGDLCWIDAAWIMAKAISSAQAQNPAGFTTQNVISNLDEAASQDLYIGPCEFDSNGDRNNRPYDIYAYKKDSAGDMAFEKVGIYTARKVFWKPYGPFMTWVKYLMNQIINLFRHLLIPKPWP
jgi:hypothetical protein